MFYVIILQNKHLDLKKSFYLIRLYLERLISISYVGTFKFEDKCLILASISVWYDVLTVVWQS